MQFQSINIFCSFKYMFLYFKNKYCPVCGVKGVKIGKYYKCRNCETIFSNFGIVIGPFEKKIAPEELIDFFEDN